MTDLQPGEKLIPGAHYEDTEGDIIGPMKSMSGADRWSGKSQAGRRKALCYYPGGLAPANRPPLLRRVLSPITAEAPKQPRPVRQLPTIKPAQQAPRARTGGYDYATERPHIFTEDGQRMFLSIRDRSKSLLKTAGAFRLQEVIAGETGDTWRMIACVDRLVELGEIDEITSPGAPGQYRIFTA